MARASCACCGKLVASYQKLDGRGWCNLCAFDYGLAMGAFDSPYA